MIKFLSKHLQLILLIIMLVVLAVTVKFLYENFYKTITEAEEVTVLKRQVSPVVFKEKSWERVMASLDEKFAVPLPAGNINDPFKQ